jgi:hypothetical protein
MVVHNLARMAFGVMATVSFLLIWSAGTVVAQAPGYAPAPGPASGENISTIYHNEEADGLYSLYFKLVLKRRV